MIFFHGQKSIDDEAFQCSTTLQCTYYYIVHTLGKRCHLPSFNRLRLRMATMIFHAWHLQLFVDLGVRVEYLLPLLMDSDNFFSSSCKVAEQFDQNIPLNHVHEGRNIDYKVHDKNKMLAPACWVDALLFFGIIKSNYTMDRQLCYRKKPRGPRGLQLSKGSFNVTSLTVHNVNITYNISSTLWEKHKLRPTLGYLPVRVFKKVYLNNSNKPEKAKHNRNGK